jgi:GTP cyclohydrolase I
VVIEADHTCMSLRGARAEGARTVTAALLGRLRDDPKTRAEFLSLTRDRAVRR